MHYPFIEAGFLQPVVIFHLMRGPGWFMIFIKVELRAGTRSCGLDGGDTGVVLARVLPPGDGPVGVHRSGIPEHIKGYQSATGLHSYTSIRCSPEGATAKALFYVVQLIRSTTTAAQQDTINEEVRHSPPPPPPPPPITLPCN